MKRKIDHTNQQAFQALANKLIFTEENVIELNSETVSLISEKIQKQFIHVLDQKHTNIDNKIVQMFGLNKSKQVNKPFLTDQMLDFNPRDFIRMLSGLFVLNSVYDGIGFTPKLAELSQNDVGGINCVGIAIAKGIYCKMRGLKVEMGITSDHPLIFVHVGKDIYIVEGMVEKARGKFKSFGKYKIFYPQNHSKWKMIFVHDFDRAVVYEILENFEALKYASITPKGFLLPESVNKATELIINNEIIQQGDWSYIQRTLFPEIVESYVVHRKKWTVQVQSIQKMRTEDHLYKMLGDILSKAVSLSQFDTIKNKDERKRRIVEMILPHTDTLIVCTMLDLPVPDFVDEKIRVLVGAVIHFIGTSEFAYQKPLKKLFIALFLT